MNTINNNIIEANLENVLKKTSIQGLGTKIQGKVRDVYDLGDKLAFITTDRQSAFDRNLAFVPFKGQLLTQTSLFWFEHTKDIVDNHLIDSPDPSVMIGKKLTIFPVEFVMRKYLTGVTSTSVWTAYKNGDREFCGNTLPEGMIKNQPFEKPLITPTTKDDDHDEKITPKEIIAEKRMTEDQWNQISAISYQLFERGTEIAANNNLILVDTKYEFGYDENGKIYLCDEIHTPDSSRFWIKDTYEERFKNGNEPEYIDKEFLRLWFKDNCDPYKDKELPEAPKELIVELTAKYIQLYQMITGKTFDLSDPQLQLNIEERIVDNLTKSGYIK